MSEDARFEFPKGWLESEAVLLAISKGQETYEKYVETAIVLLQYIFEHIRKEQISKNKDLAIGFWYNEVVRVATYSQLRSAPDGIEKELKDFIDEKSAYLQNWHPNIDN
jgi:hypothetical protein